jgi:mono/diheme cytochrome c family protein
MKKIFLLTAAVTCILFISLPALSQSDKTTGADKKAIPADVMKVFDKSCAACHKEPGKKMALGPLNLSGWDKYAPEKQAAKANAICNILTKAKMPPKGFKESNPGAIPTADDVKLICNWATSLQPKEK